MQRESKLYELRRNHSVIYLTILTILQMQFTASCTEISYLSSKQKANLGSSLNCNLTYCKSESKEAATPICCSESFNCLTDDSEDLCVFRDSVVNTMPEDFCLNQSDKCYYCCFNNACNNRKSCENHFRDSKQNSLMISVFIICIFMVALITFALFAALRSIRLNKVAELKRKHKLLSHTGSNKTHNEWIEEMQEPTE